MKKYVSFTILMIFLAASPNARAGKVENVQDAMKKQCKQKVSYDEALRLMRSLYLSCIPDTKVKISSSCSVECLKSNSGAVLGR